MHTTFALVALFATVACAKTNSTEGLVNELEKGFECIGLLACAKEGDTDPCSALCDGACSKFDTVCANAEGMDMESINMLKGVCCKGDSSAGVPAPVSDAGKAAKKSIECMNLFKCGDSRCDALCAGACSKLDELCSGLPDMDQLIPQVKGECCSSAGVPAPGFLLFVVLAVFGFMWA